MIREFLPEIVNKRLFGDRRKFQNKIIDKDTCWINWLDFQNEFYLKTQEDIILSSVINWGYKVISEINLDGKHVLEIGAGNLPHQKFWSGSPSLYNLVDVKEAFLDASKKKLSNLSTDTLTHHIKRDEFLEIEDESLDVIFTFFSLEHLYDLEGYLNFYYSKLKPGGLFVGAIPNEGGLAWGLGRYLTTRKVVHKKTNINYDKIICWEHPNYCDYILETVLNVGFHKKSH